MYAIRSYYAQVHEQVHALGAGLMQMGIQPGDRITLLSEGRNEWVISELGILYNGAINVPLSIKLNEPDEIAFRIQHSGSRAIITSGRQLQKILNLAKGIECLETIICLDRTEHQDPQIRYYEDLLQAGRNYLQNHAKDFRNRFEAVRGDNYANICYTSGTTADPKGIILSHRNYTANVVV